MLCFGALLGWLVLRGSASPLLGLLMRMAAGGTFYVVIGDLVPEAEERHFEQSSALAAAGFLTLLAVTSLA